MGIRAMGTLFAHSPPTLTLPQRWREEEKIDLSSYGISIKKATPMRPIRVCSYQKSSKNLTEMTSNGLRRALRRQVGAQNFFDFELQKA